MYLESIKLKGWRSYEDLDLSFKPGLNALLGLNAQGKTNFLEALYVLGAMKSFRVHRDSELINWRSAFALIKGNFCPLRDSVNPAPADVDIARNPEASALSQALPSDMEWSDDSAIFGDLLQEPEAAGRGAVSAGVPGGVSLEVRWAKQDQGRKPERRFLRNGITLKRAGDFLGEVPIVLFVPQDLNLVQGAPSLRRRYLDVLLCKTSSQYFYSLLRYQRVLHQRNTLLRSASRPTLRLSQGYLGENRPVTARQRMLNESYFQEKHVWDVELAKWAHQLVQERLKAVERLNEVVGRMFTYLMSNGGDLDFRTFIDSVEKKSETPRPRRTAQAALRLGYASSFDIRNSAPEPAQNQDSSQVQEDCFPGVADFLEQIKAKEDEELARGMTLIGPHRDDLRLSLSGRNFKIYGSQGQHRCAALALRLAEAHVMSADFGRKAIILLDDCLSELDDCRCRRLMKYLMDLGCQIFLTVAVDPAGAADSPSRDLILLRSCGASCYKVEQGSITPL